MIFKYLLNYWLKQNCFFFLQNFVITFAIIVCTIWNINLNHRKRLFVDRSTHFFFFISVICYSFMCLIQSTRRVKQKWLETVKYIPTVAGILLRAYSTSSQCNNRSRPTAYHKLGGLINVSVHGIIIRKHWGPGQIQQYGHVPHRNHIYIIYIHIKLLYIQYSGRWFGKWNVLRGSQPKYLLTEI